MKMAGQSERQIGEYLGVSRSVISQDDKIVLGRRADEYRPDADRLRSLLMARHEALVATYFPKAAVVGHKTEAPGYSWSLCSRPKGWSRQL